MITGCHHRGSMPYEPADVLYRERDDPAARLLAAVEDPRAGALGALAVLAVVALPHPLPPFSPAAYALLGVVEGVGLALAAENVLWRPARPFDVRRAVRAVGAVVGAVAVFVLAMVALGVDLDARDWALLVGFSVSTPAVLWGFDALKDSVRRRGRVVAHERRK